MAGNYCVKTTKSKGKDYSYIYFGEYKKKKFIPRFFIGSVSGYSRRKIWSILMDQDGKCAACALQNTLTIEKIYSKDLLLCEFCLKKNKKKTLKIRILAEALEEKRHWTEFQH